jgi:hypothetical protein
MEALHTHSPQFRHKRLAFFALLLIAIAALTATSATGSVALGIVGVVALAGALISGVTVACHKGCAPDHNPRSMMP